jgi:hypothetical protein
VRWNGPLNDFTVLADNVFTYVNLADGALWYAEIIGTVITIKCNVTTVLTYDTASDSTNCPVDDLQYRREKFGMDCEEAAQWDRKRQHPLAQRHARNDVINQLGGAFRHALRPGA